MSIWSKIEKGVSSFTDGLLSDENTKVLRQADEDLRQGKFDRAFVAAKSVLSSSPNHPVATLLAASCEWSLENEDAGIERLGHYLSHSEHPTIRVALCRMLVRAGHVDALETISGFSNLPPGLISEVEVLRGRALLARGHYEASIREFDAALMRSANVDQVASYRFYAATALSVVERTSLPPAEKSAKDTEVWRAAQFLAGEKAKKESPHPDTSEGHFYWQVAKGNIPSGRRECAAVLVRHGEQLHSKGDSSAVELALRACAVSYTHLTLPTKA